VKTTFIIDQLESNQSIFLSLFRSSSSEEYLWRPEADKWCLLEIVCHMTDEEVLDFRARVQTAMDEKKFPLVPIDPEGWVKAKKYIEQNFSKKRQEWAIERERSVAWLRSLKSPDWSSSFEHPELGSMSAGLFLANWLAHDQLHIRQINTLKRAYLEHISGQNLGYAGKW